MLDDVVRFVGQRVAAVVAETEAAAEEGCRRLEVEYEVLPAVFDPEEAMRPGAPLLQRQGRRDAASLTRSATSSPRCTASIGDVEAGFAEADVVHEGTYVTQRVQHAHLETHGAIAWLDDDGRLNVRTSTQVPFLTRDGLCAICSISTRPRSACSASGSAAASAASRRC